MIQFLNVCKRYRNGINALTDVSFKVEKGEFVFLVGPSGAGKSTVIRLILREELATSGQVYVLGKNLARMRRKDVPLYRRNIGVVFQDFKLLPQKTVYDNVAFAMRVVEAHPKDVKKQVDAVLSLVGLEERAKSLPYQLSGGEQQRVSLARAIVNNPLILLADEPTGNLDPDTAWGIVSLLDRINQMGTTVIMATHAKSIVDALKKRVIRLNQGKVIQDEVVGAYSA